MYLLVDRDKEKYERDRWLMKRRGVVEEREREVDERNERKHAPQLQNERVHSNMIV